MEQIYNLLRNVNDFILMCGPGWKPAPTTRTEPSLKSTQVKQNAPNNFEALKQSKMINYTPELPESYGAAVLSSLIINLYAFELPAKQYSKLPLCDFVFKVALDAIQLA